jgi:diaminohydroxyphosphoribosylaminopyrimidine deaminase/5-amino-6-(5-phosphoribosylamino)uracil reductase
VLVFTTQSPASAKARALARAGIEIFRTRNRRGHVCLDTVVAELGRREILHAVLEAGAALNGAALEADIVDKVVLFYAPRLMGSGGVPFARTSADWSGLKRPALQSVTIHQHAPDFAVQGYLHDVYGNYRSRRKN